MTMKSSVSDRYEKLHQAVETQPGSKFAKKRWYGRPRPSPPPEVREAAREAKAAIKAQKIEHYNAILAQVLADLGGGTINEAKRQLAKRFAAMCVQAEEIERALLLKPRARADTKAHQELCSAVQCSGSRSRSGSSPPR
jgi:hypothetical protein